jgi:hypothetical protein
MKLLAWVVLIAALAAIVVLMVRLRRRWQEQKRVAESRLASFVAETVVKTAAPPSAPPQPIPVQAAADGMPQQKLLFEAATKAGEANEPALSIQLYARLLSRYPETAFATQARANVEAQKKRLAKP